MGFEDQNIQLQVDAHQGGRQFLGRKSSCQTDQHISRMNGFESFAEHSKLPIKLCYCKRFLANGGIEILGKELLCKF